MFVALPGDHVDGAGFIPQAVARGAAAIVTEADRAPECAAPVLCVSDARKALSCLAAEFWGHPSRQLRVVGVTGTDGKTTTAFLASAVLEAGGYSTGFITTANVKIGDRQWANTDHTTTPQPPALHRQLREMVDAGVTYAIVESSSHGLRLSRLDDVAYDVAVFTNVTSEHLELHGNVERYRLDKARLFSMLARYPDKGVGKTGIVNADDPYADLYLRATAGDTITYGTNRYADVVAEDVAQLSDGLSFRVRTDAGASRVRLPMIGLFNVYNALAAICVGLSQGVSLEDCQGGLEGFAGVPGRMQRIEEGQPFGVIVDYAHTAEALSKVLRTLRPATGGRLVAVFGSAGERDRTKRSKMGAAAAQYADFSYFTNEDPRGEDEMAILRELAGGAEAEGSREGKRYLCIPDRREAIYEAFRRAKPGDMILLAGKGHESSIQLRERTIPWSDAGVARELLRLL